MLNEVRIFLSQSQVKQETWYKLAYLCGLIKEWR